MRATRVPRPDRTHFGRSDPWSATREARCGSRGVAGNTSGPRKDRPRLQEASPSAMLAATERRPGEPSMEQNRRTFLRAIGTTTAALAVGAHKSLLAEPPSARKLDRIGI